KNIIYESTRDHLNKDNLKKYYKDIFELAESGYTEAMKFIIKKEIEIESIFSSPFYDYHFDELTHITKNERNAWRERCAALGDEICLKDLSIINKPINKYDEDSTVPSKLKYYEWNERDNIKLDNYVNDLKKKDDNKSLLLLSEFYFNKDSEKSLFYADKAYKLGVSQASQYIYQYYFENRCEDKNNINEAKRYFKEWLALSKSKNSEFTYNYIKEIGDYHLNPPCSMERDLDEAIEWYLLSFSYPYGIDSSMYTQLNNLYTNEVDNNDYGMYGNMYLSALKNHSDYVLSMQARLGNMSYAEPSFLGLYEAYLLKGDIKEAYFYASLLNVNVSNVAMFHLLSESERNEIDTKIDEYINQNK
ncbi:sel1 repeat family protein, partial [Salmonella enterica]